MGFIFSWRFLSKKCRVTWRTLFRDLFLCLCMKHEHCLHIQLAYKDSLLTGRLVKHVIVKLLLLILLSDSDGKICWS